MSHAQPSEKKKWWYACKLFRTNSLKEEAMWHVDLLLGNNREISSHTTPVARQQIHNTQQWSNWEAAFST
jgi:hypothetical protein